MLYLKFYLRYFISPQSAFGSHRRATASKNALQSLLVKAEHAGLMLVVSSEENLSAQDEDIGQPDVPAVGGGEVVVPAVCLWCKKELLEG